MRIRKKSKGFTLVELMACVAILCVLIAALSFFFDGMLKVYANQNTNTIIQFDARRALTSITNDVRNASSIDNKMDFDKDYSELLFKDENTNDATYKCGQNTLELLNKNSVVEKKIEHIEKVIFRRPSSNHDILFVTVIAQIKDNSPIEYNVSSGIKIPNGISDDQPKMDLNFMENNVMNIIDPTFSLKLENITINTNARNTDNARENLFFECNTFDCSDLGKNGSNLNNGDLIVKANNLNWGDNSLAIAKQSKNGGNNVILDVVCIKGNPNLNVVQSKNYENDNYIALNGLPSSAWNKNSEYPESEEWKSKNLFDPNNKTSILSREIGTLSDKIDFSDSDIKEHIHYFSSDNNGQGSEIDINDPNSYSLNNYKAEADGSKIKINDRNGYEYSNDDYEYIICHGPLTISSPDTSKFNTDFKFKGLIYCDNVITFKNITPAFRGVLISKGIKADTAGQHQNWINISFDNNSENGGLDKINTLINENIRENK